MVRGGTPTRRRSRRRGRRSRESRVRGAPTGIAAASIRPPRSSRRPARRGSAARGGRGCRRRSSVGRGRRTRDAAERRGRWRGSARACRSRGRRRASSRRRRSPPAPRRCRRRRRPVPARCGRRGSAELTQRLRVERHQLVVGWLSQDGGDLGRGHRAELLACQGAVGAKAARDRTCDGRVSREDRPSRCALRNVGNQPEPKLIASSVSTNVATSWRFPPGSGPGDRVGAARPAARHRQRACPGPPHRCEPSGPWRRSLRNWRAPLR